MEERSGRGGTRKRREVVEEGEGKEGGSRGGKWLRRKVVEEGKDEGRRWLRRAETNKGERADVASLGAHGEDGKYEDSLLILE